MQTFVRIADSGSLSAAARTTNPSLPAVSRPLALLEAELGVRLLQERLAAKDLAQTRAVSQLVAERSMRRRGSTA